VLTGSPRLLPPCFRWIELAGVAFALDHEWIEVNVTQLTLSVLIQNARAINAQLILEFVDDVALELMTFASG
jgi:hypothetical protein